MSNKFTITREEVTIVADDGTPRTISLKTPQGRAVAKAIKVSDFATAKRYATDRMAAARDYVKDAGLDLDTLPGTLKERALRMADQGQDPIGLAKFWERLQKNPSKRAVEGLFTFLDHSGIPILKDGTFLAYKGVGEDLYDKHSHTNLNKPGSVFKMDRNQVSDDPRTACHEGLHVGSHEYAGTFVPGGREVACRVAPENVVCIPYDESSQKMRTCEYEVVGHNVGKFMQEDEDLDGFEDVETSDDAEQRFALVGDEIEHDTNPRYVEASAVRGFGRLSSKQLMDKSIDELRAYAKKLKIVGASKVTGGKAALIKKITRVRQGSRG